MANSMMATQADRLLNWIKGTTFTAAPATLWVALLSTNPTTNTGTSLVEISGSAYARQSVASSAWSAITQNADTIHDQISNSNAITFPIVTSPSYTVIGVAIYDAVTAGNILDTQPVTSQAVAIGNQYVLAIGALQIQF